MLLLLLLPEQRSQRTCLKYISLISDKVKEKHNYIIPCEHPFMDSLWRNVFKAEIAEGGGGKYPHNHGICYTHTHTPEDTYKRARTPLT